MSTYEVRKTVSASSRNPTHPRAYSIIRVTEVAPGRSIRKRLHISFPTAENARAYIIRLGAELDRMF